ncbi:RAD53 [Candida jiufengensis]|uniref:RAD53 n=1 Tax=Candida jiufengensis TaxID=497108 RepID=UPI0022250B9E|nr:RAD53 [Candida jiufengensis]KAI5953226.1 RAD53 [Candida jiufengensis]
MELTQLSQTQPTQQSPLTQTQNKLLDQSNPNQICQLLCSTNQYPNKKLNTTDKIEKDGKLIWNFGRSIESDLQLNSSSRLSNKHFILWFNINDNSLWIKDISTNGTYLNGSRLVKGSNYLLNQGDEISVGNGIPKDIVKFIIIFTDKYNPALSPDSSNIKDQGIFKDFIIKNETIGQGAFATVKKCIERSTGNGYAVKIINRRKALNISSNGQAAGGGGVGGGNALIGVDRELSILEKLNHPNIVSLKAFYEDLENYYIIMELVPGGDLMDFVAANGAIGEDATQVITKQILEGISYVHKLGISHRDLKPDNILIMQDDPIFVKITDFGLAKFSDNSSLMKTFCGTLAYVAPEVITGKYGSSQILNDSFKNNYSSLVDIWSLGCLIYVLLTSHLPFNGKTQQQMFQKIKQGEFHESPLNSYEISDEGRDFLRCCLQVDPMKRITAEEALKHQWLQDILEDSSQQQPQQNDSSSSLKSLSLSQSQSQQSRKIENGIHIESMSKIDEDIMLRPLDSERNRKSTKQKQQDFKKPKRIVPLPQSQPLNNLPMSQPLKRPFHIDPITNKREESKKRIKIEQLPDNINHNNMNNNNNNNKNKNHENNNTKLLDLSKSQPVKLNDDSSDIKMKSLSSSSLSENSSPSSIPAQLLSTSSLVKPNNNDNNNSNNLNSINFKIILEPISKSLISNYIEISKNYYSIGRAEVCDMVILDDRLSKVHCILKINEETKQIWLCDMSTNSCKVNNLTIGKGKKILLNNNDQLFLINDSNTNEFIGYNVKIKTEDEIVQDQEEKIVNDELEIDEKNNNDDEDNNDREKNKENINHNIKIIQQSIDEINLKNSLIESI